MEKLFGLTVMALKYQLLTATRPEGVLTVTETHFEMFTLLLSNSMPINLQLFLC